MFKTPQFQVEPTLTAKIYTQEPVKILKGEGKKIRLKIHPSYATRWYNILSHQQTGPAGNPQKELLRLTQPKCEALDTQQKCGAP